MPARPSFLRGLVAMSIILILMYFGRSVFVPLAFSVLIAFVIYPICLKFEKWGLGRIPAILLGEFMVFLLVGGVLTLLVWQFSAFLEQWPVIRQKLQFAFSNMNQLVIDQYGVPVDAQWNYLQSLLFDNTNQLFSFVQNLLFVSANGLVMFVLIPFYTALILIYRNIWVKAIIAAAGEVNRNKVIRLVKGAIRKYFDFVKGMLLVYLIVGILNSIGLAILGVPHPILFGVIASVLTFVPYFGIMVGALLPMAVSWVTFDSVWYPIGVAAIFALVQYLEANFIFPLAVSVKLKVNTLVSIVAIFAGAVIWGAAGMILFVPFLGILKLIANEVEGWEPLAIFLGDGSEDSPKEMPE
ncbi:MAG TPA: AI-2E family transporter [Cryomorphaceae bacterium]|nr:AI-2E family transporter [Cryomorphaceae bacterium]